MNPHNSNEEKLKSLVSRSGKGGRGKSIGKGKGKKLVQTLEETNCLQKLVKAMSKYLTAIYGTTVRFSDVENAICESVRHSASPEPMCTSLGNHFLRK